MGTAVETEDIDTVLDAVEAAHRAVDADRVSTVLNACRATVTMTVTVTVTVKVKVKMTVKVTVTVKVNKPASTVTTDALSPFSGGKLTEVALLKFTEEFTRVEPPQRVLGRTQPDTRESAV